MSRKGMVFLIPLLSMVGFGVFGYFINKALLANQAEITVGVQIIAWLTGLLAGYAIVENRSDDTGNKLIGSGILGMSLFFISGIIMSVLFSLTGIVLVFGFMILGLVFSLLGGRALEWLGDKIFG